MFGTIRSRIFAALFVVALIPTAVAGVLGYHCAKKAVTELAQKYSHAVADARSAAVETWIGEREASLSTLGSLLAAEGTSAPGPASDLLSKFRAIDPAFEQVALYDDEWDFIAGSPAARDESAADATFRAAIENAQGPSLSAAHGDAGGDEGLHIGLPIRSAEGANRGFLLGNINVTRLTPILHETDGIEALGRLRGLMIRIAATGFAACLTALVVAVWISRVMGKPLKSLMQVACSIRGGNVEERLEQTDFAEAEEVRSAFNAMLDELREKQEHLVKAATQASVRDLTSSVVHEMRNPLSSIKMNLQALSRAVEKDGRHNELGEIALQQTMRLEQMLTDLLSFGKPVKLREARVPFGGLATAILEATADSAAKNDVRISMDNRLNGVALHVDKEQMCRALTNLIGNAIEAMPSGGTVSLKAQEIAGEIELLVRDKGTGLSEEALQRAFNPFYTTKPNGTGLGLAYVKKIVELHGGTVMMKNRAEGGAVFRLVLPAASVSRP